MAMRRCLMKLQNTGLCARSNYTSGLLSKQHPHHHQLKLHGIRALSEGPPGTNSSNPDSKSGSPQKEPLNAPPRSKLPRSRRIKRGDHHNQVLSKEHHCLLSVKIEIKKLQVEMKEMRSDLAIMYFVIVCLIVCTSRR